MLRDFHIIVNLQSPPQRHFESEVILPIPKGQLPQLPQSSNFRPEVTRRQWRRTAAGIRARALKAWTSRQAIKVCNVISKGSVTSIGHPLNPPYIMHDKK